MRLTRAGRTLLARAKRRIAVHERKIAVRVVSMPSTTTFDRQSSAYKLEVLPAKVPRIAVEMGSTDGWWKYGVAAVVGIDTYGESAPAPVLRCRVTPKSACRRSTPCARPRRPSRFGSTGSARPF